LAADYGLIPGEDRITYPESAAGEVNELDATWGRPSIRFAEEADVGAVLGETVRAWADFAEARREGA
jgi:hypothetical protein